MIKYIAIITCEDYSRNIDTAEAFTNKTITSSLFAQNINTIEKMYYISRLLSNIKSE